jgi:DNA mismatch endonuclease (patch repair protein)
MTDHLTKERRSYNMSQIKSSGTKPELKLFALLKEMFPNNEIIEYPEGIPGKPDALIPDFNLVIFADGCFFHCCPKHGHIPKSNLDYWENKLKRNKARDRKLIKNLKS